MTKKSNKKITQQGFDKLTQELDQRKNTTRRQLQDQLNEEISRGDISENASYYAVQEEIGSNDKRISELDKLIKNADVIDYKKSSRSTIQVGNTVVLEKDKEELTFSIVGATEANPAKKKISIESPMGKSLSGKKKGEKVTVKTPKQNTEYIIKEVR